MKPTYDKVQEMKKAGKEADAQKLVDSLSDEEYKAYQQVKSSELSKATTALTPKVDKIVTQVEKLLSEGKQSEAQKIVDGLTDKEYEVYKTIRNRHKMQQAMNQLPTP